MNGKRPTIKNILDPLADFETRFIPNLEDLKKITEDFKQFGYKVVLTQGVYDLIHEGHGKYLENARLQGDVLIVGVDTDELTRERKGPNRPIVPENERLRMLTFLRSVDIVTLRTSEAVAKDIDYLHKALRPDVFIMSHSTKDFPVEKKVEVEKYVKRVEIFEPQAETSTSARIRHLMIGGATDLGKRLLETVQDYVDEMKGAK